MQCAAIFSLVGFAVQQFLQLLDPLISAIPVLSDANSASAANKKKALMGLISFGLGLAVVNSVDSLRILDCAGFKDHTFLDPALSALVVSAGTEASNTVQKLLSYSKDKIKPSVG